MARRPRPKSVTYVLDAEKFVQSWYQLKGHDALCVRLIDAGIDAYFAQEELTRALHGLSPTQVRNAVYALACQGRATVMIRDDEDGIAVRVTLADPVQHRWRGSISPEPVPGMRLSHESNHGSGAPVAAATRANNKAGFVLEHEVGLITE